MDAIETLITRRSIRKYTTAEVSEQDIHIILEAAMQSPSAFDERPWHFVIIKDKILLENLAENMPHCEMLKEAQIGILICGDKSVEKFPGFWIQDCSACAENILLAAHAMGLGAVWIGVYPVQERMDTLSKTLNVPKNITPFALISIGYPDEVLEPDNRYDKDKVHINTW